MAESKIHPLWYSEFIPVLFFVSSIFAGLSMVNFESGLSHKVFHDRLGKEQRKVSDRIPVGLGRICAGTMFVYLFLKLLVLVHSQEWRLLLTGWGAWYLLEMIGFVLLPMGLYFRGVRKRDLKILKAAAIITLIGIILNRLNISVIAFDWYSDDPYIPSWEEVWVTATVISIEIWALRWVMLRMPVLSDPPKWSVGMDEHH